MPYCPQCKKSYPPKPPVLSPPCPTCGYNPMRTGAQAKEQDEMIIRKACQEQLRNLTVRPIDTVPVASEILGELPADDPVNSKMAKRVLGTFVLIYDNANFIKQFILRQPKVFPMRIVLAEIEEVLRYRADAEEGHQIISDPKVKELASTPALAPDRLSAYLKQGWEIVLRTWPLLHERNQRQDFISNVFAHDKGYPIALASALNYVPPRAIPVDQILFNWLQAERNTDIYTSWSISRSITVDNIRNGWTLGITDQDGILKRNNEPYYNQYKQMWSELVGRVAAGLESSDPEELLRAISDNRGVLKEGLSPSLSSAEIDAFVDEHFDEVWEYIMKHPPLLKLNPSLPQHKDMVEAYKKSLKGS